MPSARIKTNDVNIIYREDLFEDVKTSYYLEVDKCRYHLMILENLVSSLIAFHSDSSTHLHKCQIDVTLTLDYRWQTFFQG